MQAERMIIHPSFCTSASRLIGMLWLPIWCLILVGLWEPIRVEAQDALADRAPIFELHFDQDSLRVVHNEMNRTRRAEAEGGLDSASVEAASRAPSAPRFPFQAVANNQAKKIVWFNADGTIRAQRSFSPQAFDVRVSANGAYVLVVHEKGGESRSADVELLDAQGTSLWRTLQDIYFGRYWSPTGETVVSVGGPETPELSFWSPQGQVAKYETLVLSKPTFSANGRFLLVAERPLNEQYAPRDTTFLSLFDKQGQRLWQRPFSRRHRNNDVFISESGQSMAYAHYDPDSYVEYTPKRYLSVLNHDGDIVWTQPTGKVYELSFFEQENLILMLTNKYLGPIMGDRDSEDLEVVVLNASTGVIQRRFPLPDFYGNTRGGCGVFKLVNDELVLGYLKRTREGDFSAHLQIYGPTGVLSWERSLNPGTEDWDSAVPVWSQRGSLIGISIGRVFQLFDVSRHNSPEE